MEGRGVINRRWAVRESLLSIWRVDIHEALIRSWKTSHQNFFFCKYWFWPLPPSSPLLPSTPHHQYGKGNTKNTSQLHLLCKRRTFPNFPPRGRLCWMAHFGVHSCKIFLALHVAVVVRLNTFQSEDRDKGVGVPGTGEGHLVADRRIEPAPQELGSTPRSDGEGHDVQAAGCTCSLPESTCWKPLGPTLPSCCPHFKATVFRNSMKRRSSQIAWDSKKNMFFFSNLFKTLFV